MASLESWRVFDTLYHGCAWLFVHRKTMSMHWVDVDILSYAKIVQTERNEACFKLLRCRLSYAKIVQTERNETCFRLLRCRLSYAKIRIFFHLMKLFHTGIVCNVLYVPYYKVMVDVSVLFSFDIQRHRNYSADMLRLSPLRKRARIVL